MPLLSAHDGGRRLVVPVLALALGATACSTTLPMTETYTETVQQEGQLGNGEGLDEAGGVDADSGAGLGPGSTSGSGSEAVPGSATGSGSAPGSSSGGGTVVGSTESSNPGGVASGGKNGPGITRDTIKIGVTLIGDLDALSTVGVSGDITAEDLKKMAQAAIDEVNASGGIGGRKVAADFLAVKALTSPNFDTTAQEVCDHYTVDTKVFAVIGNFNKNQSAVLPSCLGKRGVVFAEGANSIYLDNADTNPYYPYYYRFGELGLDNYATYVQGLWDQGFLTRSSKVGVLYYDSNTGKRAWNNVVQPALKRLGVTSLNGFAFPKSSGSSGSGDNENAAASSAVLQFKRQGVDRVIFVASSGDIPFYFLPAAQSQAYFPKYGFSSSDSPGFTASNSPPSQMAGARMVGWSLTRDVSSVPSDLNNASWKRCVAAMKKYGGYDESRAKENAFTCDPYFTLQTALKGVGDGLNAVTLRARMDAGGGTFDLADLYGTKVRPRWTGLVGAVQYGAYDSGCTCFQKIGGPRSIP